MQERARAPHTPHICSLKMRASHKLVLPPQSPSLLFPAPRPPPPPRTPVAPATALSPDSAPTETPLPHDSAQSLQSARELRQHPARPLPTLRTARPRGRRIHGTAPFSLSFSSPVSESFCASRRTPLETVARQSI